MAALVQSLPQQSTVTMLQTRPSSSSGHFSQGSTSHQRGASVPRNFYNGGNNGPYRGQGATGPVAPYAFTATPSLTSNPQHLRQRSSERGLRPENRTVSDPLMATTSSPPAGKDFLPQLSFGSLPDVDISDAFSGSDVGRLPTSAASAPAKPQPTPAASQSAAKAGPNRYRHNQKRSESGSAAPAPAATPAGSTWASMAQLYTQPQQPASTPTVLPATDFRRSFSKDDSELDRRSSNQPKRYSRRSIAPVNIDDGRLPSEPRIQNTGPPPNRSWASVVSTPYIPERKEHRPYVQPPRPDSSRGRSDSNESRSSTRSNSRPSSKRGGSGVGGAGNPAPSGAIKQEAKPVAVPLRGSSDTTKRLNAPSPLSRPMDADGGPTASKGTFASVVASSLRPNGEAQPARVPESPAVAQLAALNKQDAKKDAKSSRLRRAFSFGSAAELRKASAENSHNNNTNNAAAERARLHKEQFRTDEEAREAAIVQQQEASGLGAGIYSGQGNFFTGSTDNLSISSTASSASIMLRKMGKNVKKTSRSLVGLFRPKSVIGVPAADAAVPEPSMAAVSMVTVEAEREKVNVNLDPHEHSGGGTGFPKLERNSLDTAIATRNSRAQSIEKSADQGKSRPSIVGGEKERAEVLAAVRKGILKRHGTDSAASSPYQGPSDLSLPQLPRFSDSPHSSAPSTPVDDPAARGHRRTDSVNIEGEDYFASVNRFAGGENKSLPGTPRSSGGRNISFSPRIQFHDTWPSGEYDRRGDIATCNRLTPILAQAIKEELNTFKMEMEVHESSKIYTHFF